MMKCIAVLALSLLCSLMVHAQVGEQILKPKRQVGNPNTNPQTPTNPTNPATAPVKKDSMGFEHRVDDSVTVSYRMLDSVRSVALDSSINDFDKYFPVPHSVQMLGNDGAAAFSLVYSPNRKAGWDPGFHAFDAYKLTVEGTRFYKTTKPFTQLNYMLSGGKEQIIKVLHTQSPKPNLNFGFDYRLINAPGFFTSQNSNHNAFRVFGNYQGKRKRYASSVIMVGNNIRNSENGGILNDDDLSKPDKKQRSYIDVNLGNGSKGIFNPFVTSVTSGNVYKDFTFFFRNSYDIGKKDSVAVNDSTTEYLFYPKLRLQHTFSFSRYSYNFIEYQGDSLYYKKNYDTTLGSAKDTLQLLEKWKIISNDFSLVQFPETKNPAQFFLVGIRLENINGVLSSGTTTMFNAVTHAEYRNKTRNKLWDILAKGELYTAGFNSGDYNGYISLGRYLNSKLGNVQLFFNNTSRSASFIYNKLSSFNFRNNSSFKKENNISFGARSENALFTLGFANHLVTNLAYFTNFYQTAQYTKLINLLQVYGSKKIRLTWHWNWYTEAVFQQTDGSAPVKVPLIFTRNRIAFEGVFYKNLHISTGLDLRYYTPYEAYNYSPAMGQFVPQDTVKIYNRPDIAVYAHFRIKSFTGYLRAENLNTISFRNGFGFTDNNFAAPHYPTQGMIIRFGIKWGFIN